MQQHPVPRNITGFQFKLIGDMTLKQFSYLAVGVVVGYILFRVSPLPGALRLALGLLLGGSGAALAFVPIQGRPLDVWIKAYFKNVYSPTQFIWKKQNPPPKILLSLVKPKRISQKKQNTGKQYEDVERKLNSYLKKTEKKPHETLDNKENLALKQTEAMMQKTRKGGRNIRIGKLEAREEIDEKEINKSNNQEIIPQRDKRSNLTSTVSHPTSKAEDIIRKRIRKELEQQYKAKLERLKHEKFQIEKKIRWLETKSPTEQQKRPFSAKEQSHLHILSQNEATQAGLPINMDKPNIVVGTIIDPQQQQLPDILVTIKNKQAKIVRALKTNNLGQFVSLTPLPNGEYILEAEDPNRRFKFDIIRIGLHGKKFPPIEIIGKVEKESNQEEIRKKLFNKQEV